MSIEETKACLDNAQRRLAQPIHCEIQRRKYEPFQFFSFALGVIACTAFVTLVLLLSNEFANGKFIELESGDLPRVVEFHGKLYHIRRAYTELDNE